MQTFIPLATRNFNAIAKTLDNKRLNKQALEGWQILMTLLELDPQGNHRTPKGWVNHPAVKMWRGHEAVLTLYIIAMVDEWQARGFKSTIATKAMATYQVALLNAQLGPDSYRYPEWMEDQQLFEEVAATHRQALLVKDYGWYSQFNWDEDPGYPPVEYTYKWPETKGETETNE